MAEHKCLKEADIAEMKNDIKTLYNKIEEIKKDTKNAITEVKEETRSLRRIYKTVQDLAVSVATLTQQLINQQDDITIIKKDVEDIKKLPASNFNALKVGLVSSLIGAFVTAAVVAMLKIM